MDYDSIARGGLVLRLGGGDGDRRALLHGAARAAGGEVLHARVVREVHAVPRGDALARPAPREDRGRPRRVLGPRPARERRLAASSAARSARSATSPSIRCRATCASSAAEFEAHIDAGRLPVRRRVVDRGNRRAGDQHAIIRSRRCPRDRPCPGTVPGRRPRGHAPGMSLGHVCRERRVSAPELVTVTVDGVEVQVPKGTGLVETALAAGIEIPVFCYEPRLGPPVGACRMCLCEVEGMPKMQTACTMTAHRRDDRAQRAHVAEGRRGAELDARVHPRQPPARLPGLRQGRRVPAAGPDVPLRPRLDAHVLPEAHVREADPDLADDRARPRALHPLLPLHALQRERLRGHAARRAQPRRRSRSSRRSRTSRTSARSAAT